MCGDEGAPLQTRQNGRQFQPEDGNERLEVAGAGGEEGEAAEEGDHGLGGAVEDVEDGGDEGDGEEDGRERVGRGGERGGDDDEPHEEEAELALMRDEGPTESWRGVESDLRAWNTLLRVRGGEEKNRRAVAV